MRVSPAAEKAALRIQFKTLRNSLSERNSTTIRTQLDQALPSLLAKGQRLGLYWPLPGEIDWRPLATLQAIPLALPAVSGGRLLYRAWIQGEPLSADECGIPAPLGNNLSADDLGCLLVPALAIDREGLRLGYGGGWYDRLRADLRWQAVPSFAVLPRGCLTASLPREPWDVPLAGWLDETGLHRLDSQSTLTKR